MRVLLDANVLIAAVAGHGLCESLLELCMEEHDLIISEELLGEIRRNLVRKVRLPDTVAVDFCRLLRNHGVVATPAAVPEDACRDPKDLYLLGLCQSAHAEFLVTGDKDLLECVRYGTTQVVMPRQFWENCRQK